MGKNKGGAQNNNNTGGQGGGNHGGLSSADIARVKAMTAKEDREAKAKADSKLKCDLERKLAKKYGLKKAKGRSSTDSSDSDSDDDSSDDSDSRRKKKKARKKKQSKREKDAKSEQKRMADELTKIKDELESAKSFKEEIRAYFKKEQPPGTPEPTMTRAQWEEFESKKRAKPPRYLFTADIEREEKSASSASVESMQAIVKVIRNKLTAAEEAQSLSLGFQVSSETEKNLKDVAAEVADKYFDDGAKAGLTALLEIKTDFKIDTNAKLPRTLIATFLRACISRSVNLTEEELGL